MWDVIGCSSKVIPHLMLFHIIISQVILHLMFI